MDMSLDDAVGIPCGTKEVESDNQFSGNIHTETSGGGSNFSHHTTAVLDQDVILSEHDDTDESDASHTTSGTEDIDEEQVGPDINYDFPSAIAAFEPYVGMEFKDEEEAYNYYNMYAKEKGFSVRKNRVERSRADRHIISKSYVCSNEGKKNSKDKRRKVMDYRPRATKKTNCGAAMRVKAVNGKWVVDILVLDHNHDLVDPKDSFRLRSHQKATKSTVHLIERLQRCGVTPSQIFTILKDFAGGEQYTGISDVRFRSLLRAKRRKSLGVDCQLAVSYLEGKRAADPNFFFSICVNKEQELTGIFWVDGRAREQYKWFGDVVVFDTTYRKNKYKFPFAPFTGVNHHMQCILFGCGLIADETKESFEWLFSTWAKAMHGVHPKSILTDEDPGIMRAVGKVFPATVHRLCAWHLEKHRLNHMGPLFRKFPDLRQMFYNTVQRSGTPTEFESSWETMITTFNLENHKWLRKKFKKRKHWVPCYFPDTFFAGMTTTQRAESMTNYFKGYFSSSTPINEFITQYEEAVMKRRGIESKADVNCITSTPCCSTSHPIEMHAAEVYTSNVFKVFKDEWKECLAVEIQQCLVDPPVKRYEAVSSDRWQHVEVHVVVDNVEADEISCSCKMFEQTGIVCKHIMKVLVINDRRRIPPTYILPRWTKAARYTNAETVTDFPTTTDQPQQQVWVLNDMAQRLVSEGCTSSERFRITYQGLTNLRNDVLQVQALGGMPNNDSERQSTGTTSVLNGLRAVDPTNQSVTRGRPIQARITSAVESFQQRRSYRCSACGKTGHNVVRCPQGSGGNVEGINTVQRQPMFIDLNGHTIHQYNMNRDQVVENTRQVLNLRE